MNSKPELREETVSERRLKRQIRRFITLESECERSATAMLRLSRSSFELHSAAKVLDFWLRSHLLYTPYRIVARTPQEKRLKDMYKQIMALVKSCQISRDRINGNNLSRIAHFSKQVLHETRRDKDMQSWGK